ncbi:MAG: EF-Tu/IF-2/RF-3 family GTPase [Hyphomicrobium sp.]
MIGIDASEAVGVSAKTGLNVKAVLEAIVERLPPPTGDASKPLKAMLVDSWYDAYLGVIVLVRIKRGILKRGQKVQMMRTGGHYQVERVGIFRPKQEMLSELGPGEVGFFTAAIKEVADTRVGDTVTDEKNPTAEPLPGFKPAQTGGVLRTISGRCG